MGRGMDHGTLMAKSELTVGNGTGTRRSPLNIISSLRNIIVPVPGCDVTGIRRAFRHTVFSPPQPP